MNTRFSMNGSLVTSLAALALMVITLLVTVPPLLGAVFGRSAQGTDPADRIAMHVEQHKELMDTYKARFNGRSVFFRPPPPPRRDPPPQVVETPVREEPKPPPPPPPGPPPPPTNYQGPGVAVVLGDRVLFRNTTGRDGGTWIAVGEEKDGIEVVATNAPRSVTVRHQRGEYEVPVFNWEMPFFQDSSMAGQPIPGLISAPSSPSSNDAAQQPSRPGQRTAPPPGAGRSRAVPTRSDASAREAAFEQGIEMPEDESPNK